MSIKITVTLSGDMKDHLDIVKDMYREMMDRYKELEERKAARASDEDAPHSKVVIRIEEEPKAEESKAEEPKAEEPYVEDETGNDLLEALVGMLNHLSLTTDFDAYINSLTDPSKVEDKKSRDASISDCTGDGNCALCSPMGSCLAGWAKVKPSNKTAETAPCCDNCPDEAKSEGKPEAETPKGKDAGDLFDPEFLFSGMRDFFPGIILTAMGQGKTTAPTQDKAPAAEKPEAEEKPQKVEDKKVEDEVEKAIEDLTEVARASALAALEQARKLTGFLKNFGS